MNGVQKDVSGRKMDFNPAQHCFVPPADFVRKSATVSGPLCTLSNLHVSMARSVAYAAHAGSIAGHFNTVSAESPDCVAGAVGLFRHAMKLVGYSVCTMQRWETDQKTCFITVSWDANDNAE